MIPKAEVMENGMLRVKSSDLKPGDEVLLETSQENSFDPSKGRWSDIEKIAAKLDSMDFPRRTHEEIIRDRHRLKGE